MLRRLRWKLTAVLLLLLSAVLITVLAIQTTSVIRQFRDQTNRALTIALQGGSADRWEMGAQNDAGYYTAIPTFCVTVSGSLPIAHIVSYNGLIDQEVMLTAVNQALSRPEDSGDLSELELRYIRQSLGGQLRIAFADLTWEQSSIRQQLLTACLTLIAALLVLFVISFLFSRWLVRPAEHSWKRQQQFIADASHELKTPLTVLLANVDILSAHPQETIAQQSKWLNYIRDEALRMQALVEDMLFLAREDSGSALTEPPAPFSLSDLCWNCQLAFEPVAFEQGAALQGSIVPDLTVTGRETDLRRLITILLDNACKYCGPGGQVTLSLAAEADRAILTVHNTGQPIPPEEQAHLFERFYRADPSRHRRQGGYGLGLAIAAAIAQAHHGRLTVRSTPEDGTAFTLTLPR